MMVIIKMVHTSKFEKETTNYLCQNILILLVTKYKLYNILQSIDGLMTFEYIMIIIIAHK